MSEQLGGLPRKAGQLELARQQPAAVLALDAGALLFKRRQLNPGTRDQELTGARGLAAAYRQMAYDAVGINAVDLAAGVDFLRELTAEEQGPAWLSADLLDPLSGRLIFPAAATLERGGWRIGIIGLTGAPAADDPELERMRGYSLRPWPEALANALAQLQADPAGEPELLILLSGLSREENEELARQFPDIHLILLAGLDREANLRPYLVNNSLLTASGRQGKRLGLLHLAWTPDRIWADRELEELAAAQAQLDNLNWQWRSLQRSLEQAATSAAGQAGSAMLREDSPYRQRMAAYQEELQAEIRETEILVARLAKTAGQRRTAFYESRFVSLDQKQPEDPAMLAFVAGVTNEINEIGRLQAQARRERAATESPSPYLGWQSCRQCHPSQTANWQQTRHAKAYQTLVERQRQYDLNCIACHITGLYEDAAQAIALPAPLQGVGCESCHGPGREHQSLMTGADHRQPPRDKKISRSPQATTCLRCHTPTQSPDFDFAAKRSYLEGLCRTP